LEKMLTERVRIRWGLVKLDGARRTPKVDSDLSLNFVNANAVLPNGLARLLGRVRLFGSQGLWVYVQGSGLRGKKEWEGGKKDREVNFKVNIELKKTVF
jgi:hypothetical protein